MQKKIKIVMILLSVVLTLSAVSYAMFIHPAEYVAAAAATMPSYGEPKMRVVDISMYQDSSTTNSDNINFALLKTQVDAVYIRACGNAGSGIYIDKQAANYAVSAQQVGLKFGFYLYYIPTADLADAKSQAQFYYNFIKDYGYSCVPVLDVENNDNNLTKAQLAAAVKTFADEFASLSRLNLMIYSYPYFMSQNFDTAFNWSSYKFWIAHYNVSAPMEGISQTWMPESKWCWSYWDMWQYTSTGTLSSIPNSSGGHLDLSIATDNILLPAPTSAEITSIIQSENITAGKSFSAQITVKNTDKVAWTESNLIRLGIEGTALGGNRVQLPVGKSVAPGESFTFTYSATAPSSGDLVLNIRMVKDGLCWFGDSRNVTVKARDAQIVSVSAPTNLLVGQEENISVTMKNTGLSSWAADSYYRLATDASNTASNRSYMEAGTKVLPGGSYVFTVAVQPQNTPGTAVVNLQMIQDAVALFGQSSVVQISVKNPSSAEITSVTMPDVISAGSKFTAKITVKNTDTVTWTEKDLIRLGVEGTAIGSNRVHLPSGTRLAPGESYTFTYTATAPSSGDLNLKIRMIKDGLCWFGDEKNVSVKARDAQIVSISAPADLLVGQAENIKVTVKNTGLLTWTTDSLYRLATDESNTTSNRSYMVPGTKVLPGESYEFTVAVRPQNIPGTETINLQMVQDAVTIFGQKKTVSIAVQNPSSAEISSVTMPDSIASGSEFTAKITVKNTGSVSWTEKDLIRLGIEGTAIGANRVLLPSGTKLAPGESYTFTYTAAAPSSGDLILNIQMIKDGLCWFGDATSVNVKVRDAQIVSISAPTQIIVGQTQDMTVTVKNTGLTTWTENDLIRLGIEGMSTGDNRVLLPQDVFVKPGESYTFSYKITASASGTLTLHIQMVKDGLSWFGDVKTAVITLVG